MPTLIPMLPWRSESILLMRLLLCLSWMNLVVLDWQKGFSHQDQVKSFSPVWILWCVFKWLDLEKDPQQAKGLLLYGFRGVSLGCQSKFCHRRNRQRQSALFPIELLSVSQFVFSRNKPAAQAAGADPFRCNSISRPNPPIQQNISNFWTNTAILMTWFSSGCSTITSVNKLII